MAGVVVAAAEVADTAAVGVGVAASWLLLQADSRGSASSATATTDFRIVIPPGCRADPGRFRDCTPASEG
ncbi:hypothetical protein JMUB6875_50340 [Nocardia sp. JMUB6875]